MFLLFHTDAGFGPRILRLNIGRMLPYHDYLCAWINVTLDDFDKQLRGYDKKLK